MRLQKQIRTRKVDGWIMHTRITSQPHLKEEPARQFVEGLVAESDRLHGYVTGELDEDGLELLKAGLAGDERSTIGVGKKPAAKN